MLCPCEVIDLFLPLFDMETPALLKGVSPPSEAMPLRGDGRTVPEAATYSLIECAAIWRRLEAYLQSGSRDDFDTLVFFWSGYRGLMLCSMVRCWRGCGRPGLAMPSLEKRLRVSGINHPPPGLGRSCLLLWLLLQEDGRTLAASPKLRPAVKAKRLGMRRISRRRTSGILPLAERSPVGLGGPAVVYG